MPVSDIPLRPTARDGSPETLRSLAERHLRAVYRTAERVLGSRAHLATGHASDAGGFLRVGEVSSRHRAGAGGSRRVAAPTHGSAMRSTPCAPKPAGNAVNSAPPAKSP